MANGGHEDESKGDAMRSWSSKLAAALAVASIAMLGVAPPASAATTDFSESISGSDPTFARFSEGCSGGGGGGTYHYRVFDLYVSEAGAYDYYDIGYHDSDSGTIDVYVGFYNHGEFDPAAPATGCIESLDDDGVVAFPSAGRYSLVLTTFSGGATGPGLWSLSGPGTASFAPVSTDTKDLTIWLLSTGRPTQDATCPVGYAPSWAEWPNGGAGGWVCDRYTYAYYPDEEVK